MLKGSLKWFVIGFIIISGAILLRPIESHITSADTRASLIHSDVSCGGLAKYMDITLENSRRGMPLSALIIDTVGRELDSPTKAIAVMVILDIYDIEFSTNKITRELQFAKVKNDWMVTCKKQMELHHERS